MFNVVAVKNYNSKNNIDICSVLTEYIIRKQNMDIQYGPYRQICTVYSKVIRTSIKEATQTFPNESRAHSSSLTSYLNIANNK